MAASKNSQPADTRSELIELVRRRAEIAVSDGGAQVKCLKDFLSSASPYFCNFIVTIPSTLTGRCTHADAIIHNDKSNGPVRYRTNYGSYSDEWRGFGRREWKFYPIINHFEVGSLNQS